MSIQSAEDPSILGYVVDGDLIIYDDDETGERQRYLLSDCFIDAEECA